MKGTFCGRRALSLAVLLICFAAIAPAIARADVIGAATSAVPSTPTAPAVPVPVAAPAAPVSVPAPATPSISVAPAQAAAPVAPVQVAAPVAGVTASVAKPAATVKTSVASIKAQVSKPAVSVKIKSPVVKIKATVSKKGIAASAKTKAASTGVSFGHSSVTIKLQAKSVVFKKSSPWRKLVWSGDDNQGGCKSGVYQTCTTNPPIPIDNRCYQDINSPDAAPLGTSSGTFNNGSGPLPPFSDEVVSFSKGSQTIWTKTEPVYFHGVLIGTKVHVREFSVGFQGVGSASGATYKLGTDTQDEFDLLIPVGQTIATDRRTFDMLLVDSHQAVKPLPPNMWYSEHFVLTPTSIKIQWRIVCQKGQKAPDDQDEGCDHDRSGDQDKYRHHREDYHGYNDDEPSSWDQDD